MCGDSDNQIRWALNELAKVKREGARDGVTLCRQTIRTAYATRIISQRQCGALAQSMVRKVLLGFDALAAELQNPYASSPSSWGQTQQKQEKKKAAAPRPGWNETLFGGGYVKFKHKNLNPYKALIGMTAAAFEAVGWETYSLLISSSGNLVIKYLAPEKSMVIYQSKAELEDLDRWLIQNKFRVTVIDPGPSDK
ncbi:hypothetical protein [Aquabacterium sp. NJ1]|uniref:hypothetical protein n=1 Tax=Aquabacterium sp. NJ1 TaxID=1538295 RepID=UPI00126A74E7|nr:hypothetical protein [Aquabacterium sp. NJ1]